jgi:hypothetical protein
MKTMGQGSVSSFLAGLLNVGWYVAALGLGTVLCVVVVTMFRAGEGLEIIIPVSFTLDDPGHPVTSPSLGIGEVHIQETYGIGFTVGGKFRALDPLRLRVRGSLRFPTQEDAFLAANAAILIFNGTLLLWVVGQLRAIFRTVRDGQPFVAANAMRLRWIAFAVIGYEVARAAVAFFENYYAMTHFTGEGLRFDARPDLNVLALVNGLIILGIAEVFRAGTRLDEDQSLTI